MTNLIIGDHLRALRVAKNLSQGDIEERSGLLRSYISRVENAHVIPSLETLQTLAIALEVPMYVLVYDGEEPPKLPNLSKRKPADNIAWGSSGRDARWFSKFRGLLARTKESDRRLMMFMAQKMARAKTV